MTKSFQSQGDNGVIKRGHHNCIQKGVSVQHEKGQNSLWSTFVLTTSSVKDRGGRKLSGKCVAANGAGLMGDRTVRVVSAQTQLNTAKLTAQCCSVQVGYEQNKLWEQPGTLSSPSWHSQSITWLQPKSAFFTLWGQIRPTDEKQLRVAAENGGTLHRNVCNA